MTSPPITVTGINAPAPISVTFGSYSIGTGPFVTTAGTVTNNQTVRVRHRASSYYNSMYLNNLHIGGVAFQLTSYTVPGSADDVSPDSFIFAPLSGASPGTPLTSNAITVSGITAPAPIFVTGGSYSIRHGSRYSSFTSSPGTVANGAMVMVRTNSSAINNSATTATLTLGDRTERFSVTTMESGGRTTTPAAFSFANMTGVPLKTTVTSAPITVSGITAAEAPISVSGGTYSIGTAPFTSAAGVVTNNQTVRVQQASAAGKSLDTETILNIGGVIGSFRSTTERGVDSTPDPFSFTSQTNVPLGATVTSNEITVSGLDAPVPIRVLAGSYSIDNGTFTANEGMVTNGQRVAVRHTAANTSNTASVTELTIGSRHMFFYSSTGATIGSQDFPDPFTFAPQTNVPRNSEVISAPITVTGIDAPAIIRVGGSDSSYSIDGGPFTSAAGNVNNGQTVRLRHTSASGYGSTATTFVGIGDRQTTFTSTTEARPQ